MADKHQVKPRGGRKPKVPRPKWAGLMTELDEELRKHGVPHIVVALHPQTETVHGGYFTGQMGADAIRHLLIHLAADLEGRVAEAAAKALLVAPDGQPIQIEADPSANGP